MISRESAATSGCLDERLQPEFHVFDDGRAVRPPFCPRTVEILTVLNDVFDALAPSDGAIAATA